MGEPQGVLRTLQEQIDPRHTALVIVDVQNDFVHPKGQWGEMFPSLWQTCPLIPRMLTNLKALLEAAREAGVFIIFVRGTYDPQYISPGLQLP